MKFAYADPPYLGQGQKKYDDPTYDDPEEHRELIQRLVNEYPDGWALSASSPSLTTLLPMCPDDVRIGAWVKPFCSFKPNVNPAYAWEPVIFRGGRPRTRDQFTVRDFVSENITMKKGLAGAKPKKFSYWIFQVLNAKPGDELDDLFPGTGLVTEAWEEFVADESLREERLD